MIHVKKNKDVTNIHAFGKDIINVYKKGKIIWSKISSCFGSGYWINSLPWQNNDGWKN